MESEMTIGEKIAKLRREKNHTQEQLAELMEVSRQSVSKWESNIAYPETEKIIKLSRLYGCTTDYLLNNENTDIHSGTETMQGRYEYFQYEKQSKLMLYGLPLWHICIGSGKTAKGIIAVGLRAKGIISVGLFSMGILSVGVFSFGLLSIGCMALGLLAAGSLAAGLIALGAISIGIVSFGAVAIGVFAEGALALGKYIAIGDHARGMFAFAKTEATGTVFEKVGELLDYEQEHVIQLMEEKIPSLFHWMIRLFSKLI